MIYSVEESFSIIKESLKNGEVIEVPETYRWIFMTDLGVLPKKIRKNVKYKFTKSS